MSEFNSIDDWPNIDQQIRRNLWAMHNLANKRQLERMHRNIEDSVRCLSQLSVEYRKYGHSVRYSEQLAKVQQELQELQSWLMFATLLDEKPKD
jgi:allophanate hydrolase subunit 1